MPDKPFMDPKLGLNRIYTRQGDAGETKLAGGQTEGKDSPRLECYGTVDELNCCVGMASVTSNELAAREPRLRVLAATLLRVQHELFNLGSILATRPDDIGEKQARVTDCEVAALEQAIDRANGELTALRSFVLPGGSRLSVELHLCRTVCRRAERLAVALSRADAVPGEAIRYLNRLSDAFFVWSRWVNAVLGIDEVLWDPNQAASGQDQQ